VTGTTLRIGDGVSGWVVANRQVIVNSEASLDLGSRAHGTARLNYALSVPLITRESLVGTVTLYSPSPFPESQSRLVQVIAPHLAQAIWAASSRGDAALRAGNRTAADFRLVSIR
jgi:GAF domain-containing protein